MAAELVTHFKLGWYDSPRAGRLALLTMDNGADYRKPNTFGAQGLASLNAALDEVERAPDCKGLLLTGKPFIFAVGADLNAFADATPEFAREAGGQGHRVFGRLRDLPVPTLAAINGACMGGGLEIALHCDARTLAKGAAALAFPEVFLSIVPGWGGTQLAPMLVGATNALTVIVANALDNNRTLRPAKAFELGFADLLLDPVDFHEQSLHHLEDLVTGEATVDRPTPSTDGLDEALAKARAAADARTHGATRAPYLAIDLIEHAARGGDLAEGLAREEDALAELLPARQAQASVYAFDLTQSRVKRQPWKPQVEPRPVRKVGIVGAGLLGWQIGALVLQRLEVPLVLKDVEQAPLDRARAEIERTLDERVQRRRLAPGKAEFLKSLVTYTAGYEPLAGADLVLEAVVEVLDVKRRTFADVETVVDEGCVLATNTSSLSVAAMAADLSHPERVVGLHFFNPVAVLPLIEVVRPASAGDQAMATAFAVAKRLGKSAVQCADTPAFVVNRLLTRFMGACAEAVDSGAEFRDVDEAIKQLGLPMGPFELLGLVGPAVAAHVGQTLHGAFPDRFGVNENFRMLARTGLPGVYDWSSGRPEVYAQVREQWHRSAQAQPMTGEEMRAAALEAVADECRRLLEDGTVADARDIDTCMLLGAGWPFFMGGICRYLDQTGVSQKLFGEPLVGSVDRAAAT